MENVDIENERSQFRIIVSAYYRIDHTYFVYTGVELAVVDAVLAAVLGACRGEAYIVAVFVCSESPAITDMAILTVYRAKIVVNYSLLGVTYKIASRVIAYFYLRRLEKHYNLVAEVEGAPQAVYPPQTHFSSCELGFVAEAL